MYLPREYKNTESKRCMHPDVHSNIIYNSQTMEPKYPLTDEWVKKEMVCIYTQWNITQPEKEKILPFAKTRMELECTMLSEISHRRTNTIGFHSYVEVKK